MDPGSLRAFAIDFANHLVALGHTRLTVGNYEDAACHLAEWLRLSDLSLADVDEEVVVRFARHRCKCTGIRRHRRVSAKYVRQVRRFVCFLAQRGAVKTMTPNTISVSE